MRKKIYARCYWNFFPSSVFLAVELEKEEENLINCGTLYIDLVTVLQINNMWDEIFLVIEAILCKSLEKDILLIGIYELWVENAMEIY